MRSCGESRKYFFLAVNTGFVKDRLPDARCLNFYRERSRHGLHCAIVGNVLPPGGVGSNDVCAEISNSPTWQELAEAIAEQGALPGIQLSSAWGGYRGMKRFLPSAGEDRLSEYRNIAASISTRDARDSFDALNRGTDLAVKAGFRHVQLHAAHGYLFNLLVDRRLSAHADFAAESIRKWANNLMSVKVESSVRFSMWSGHPELDRERGYQLVDEVAAMPVDYLDVSAGFYNVNKRLIYPSTRELLSERVTATLDIAKRHPTVHFILSGKSSHAWDGVLPSNVHVGICRDLIANPDYLLERSNGCSTCMKCHYFSRGKTDLTCGQWERREIAHV